MQKYAIKNYSLYILIIVFKAPTKSSKSGNTIVIDSGFTDDWHKEPPKNVTVKVVAYKDGAFSDVETYNVQIKKGNPFAGKQI